MKGDWFQSERKNCQLKLILGTRVASTFKLDGIEARRVVVQVKGNESMGQGQSDEI